MARSIKPSAYIDPVKNRNGETTSYRVRWEINGRYGGSENTGPLIGHARRRKSQILEDLWAGKLNIKGSPEHQWSDLVREFEAHHRINISERTWKEHYGSGFQELVDFMGGDFPLSAFDHHKALAFIKHLGKRPQKYRKEKTLADATVSMRLRFVSATFEYAFKPLRWLDDNPFDGLEFPSSRRRDVIIEKKLLQLLYQYAPERARGPIWILPQTGMRPGELMNIDHRQCDRKSSYVKVMRHKSLGIETDWDRKTRDEVHVPIRRNLWPLFGPPKPAGFVWEGYSSNPRYRVDQLSHDFKRARDRAAKAHPEHAAALKQLRPHDSKHTYCTEFLEKDGNIKRLSEITGTRPETLWRVYAKIANRAPLSETSRVNYGSPPALPQKTR